MLVNLKLPLAPYFLTAQMARSLSSHATWSGIPATKWSSALSLLTSDSSIKEVQLTSEHEDTKFYVTREGTQYLRRIQRGDFEVLQEILDPWPCMTPPRSSPCFMEPPPLVRTKRMYDDMPPLDEVMSPEEVRARSMSFESDSMPSLIPPDAHHIVFCDACDEDIDGLRVGNLCAPCWQEKCGCEEEQEYYYSDNNEETVDAQETIEVQETNKVQKEEWYFHTPPLPPAFDLYHPHTLLQFFNLVSSINMYAKKESSMFFFDTIPKDLADAMLDHPWVRGESSEDDWSGGPATAKELQELKSLLSDYTE